MKYLLSFLLTVSCFLSYSQNGFPTYQTAPVSVSNTVTTLVSNPSTDLYSRLIVEGESYSSQFYNAAVTWDGTTAGGGMSLGNPYAPIRGKAFVVTSITIGSSRKAIFQLSRQIVNGSNIASRHIVDGNGPLQESYIIHSWDAAPSLRILGVTDPTTGTVVAANSTTIAVTCSMSGYLMPDDFHFSAPKIIYAIGDSKLNGSGASNTEKMSMFQLRDYFTSIGQDVRYTYRAVSGSTSSNHETWRQQGYYNLDFSPAMIYIDLGTNDAIGGTTSSVYTSNVLKLVAHLRAQPRTKGAYILVGAILPLSNTTSEANAVTLRAALATSIAGLRTAGDTKTYFVDTTGSLWNAVSGAATNQSDGIHPNDTGNTAWFTALKAFVIANNIQF